MINNDILRRLRYILDLNDAAMVAVFKQAEYKITQDEVVDMLRKEEEARFAKCHDVMMATFLNGLINQMRGKREGEQPKPEKRLNNNLIFRKLKIALNLTAEEILDVMALADMRMSKHELSAFFRKPDHKNYRDCKDQILRNFLMGLQIKHRGPKGSS